MSCDYTTRRDASSLLVEREQPEVKPLHERAHLWALQHRSRKQRLDVAAPVVTQACPARSMESRFRIARDVRILSRPAVGYTRREAP